MDFNLSKIIKTQGFILLDGASGTMMHSLGIPSGECAEKYLLNNPSLLIKLQSNYYKAGADVVYTYTFGANSSKLKKYGISPDEAFKINYELGRISCMVRDEQQKRNPEKRLFVAGDIAPTGDFLAPAGEMQFEELKKIYKNQAKALFESGVDLFVVETMMDLLSTKAAVIGIKEVSDLPIMVTMTFDNMRTLSGNTPKACLVALASLGIVAFGANCSTGPEGMEEIITSIYKISDIPIIAKPNAGMPIITNGKTVFPMDSENFANAVGKLFLSGAKILGGCCGTTPEHIERLKLERSSLRKIKSTLKFNESETDEYISSISDITKICSETKYITIQADDPIKLADIIADASDEEPDCIILDFNDVDEIKISEFKEEFSLIALSVRTPLAIATSNASLLEELAKVYPGRLAYIKNSSILNQNILNTISRYGIKVV